jgi:hypothetical protein
MVFIWNDFKIAGIDIMFAGFLVPEREFGYEEHSV